MPTIRGAGEAGFGERLAAAARPDQVIGGRLYVVQPELRLQMRAVTEYVVQPELRLQMRAVTDGINRVVQYDALRRPVDSDNRNPALGRCIGIGAADHRQ